MVRCRAANGRYGSTTYFGILPLQLLQFALKRRYDGVSVGNLIGVADGQAPFGRRDRHEVNRPLPLVSLGATSSAP